MNTTVLAIKETRGAGKSAVRLTLAGLVLGLGALLVYAQEAATSAGSQAVGESGTSTFTTLANFNVANGGSDPVAALAQGSDGSFYGTTYFGGANEAGTAGTVFKINAAGMLTTLYSFCAQMDCADGFNPAAGLVQGTDGNFYGTTSQGGLHNSACAEDVPGCGTVFKISPSGELTTLWLFDVEFGGGAHPVASLIEATDGNFYGTTEYGGTGSHCPQPREGCGTVFEMTNSGFGYSFCAQTNCTDGSYPTAALVQATDGNLYGTTSAGGLHNEGTVFKLTPGAPLTTLYSFHYEGSGPGTLIQGSDGNLYGVLNDVALGGKGAIFKMTLGGSVTVLHSFSGTDGSTPNSPLVQATDGNFYGTTLAGGTSNNCNGGCGTIFEITPEGTLTTLYNFANSPGSNPAAGLIQATGGNFYGTTSSSANNGGGTVFRLAVGLGPFVETRPTSGPVGTPVTIVGNKLMGTSSVTFNGTPATFNVVSNTQIDTTVPSGATTGEVNVKTPSGTLSSNVPFRVTQ